LPSAQMANTSSTANISHIQSSVAFHQCSWIERDGQALPRSTPSPSVQVELRGMWSGWTSKENWAGYGVMKLRKSFKLTSEFAKRERRPYKSSSAAEIPSSLGRKRRCAGNLSLQRWKAGFGHGRTKMEGLSALGNDSFYMSHGHAGLPE
jgi:hypothetical protein